MATGVQSEDGHSELLGGYANLSEVLDGKHGEELRAELLQLLEQIHPPRSVRKAVRVIAKLLRTVGGCSVEETVIVHDVSESGIRVTIPAHVELLLSEAMAATFVLRLAEEATEPRTLRELRLHARCVRLIRTRDEGVELAYTFTGAQGDNVEIYKIAQWVRPREGISLRPSIQAKRDGGY